MNRKLITYIVGGLVCFAIIVALALWFQPPREVSGQPAIPITAEALFQAYDTDEQAANEQYLGQALEVTGTVTNTETNQDGQFVAFLNTGNPSGSVVCTFSESPGEIPLDQQITVKGFCAGMLFDVMLTDCVYIPTR